MVSGNPTLSWVLEPECQILMFTWSFGPLCPASGLPELLRNLDITLIVCIQLSGSKSKCPNVEHFNKLTAATPCETRCARHLGTLDPKGNIITWGVPEALAVQQTVTRRAEVPKYRLQNSSLENPERNHMFHMFEYPEGPRPHKCAGPQRMLYSGSKAKDEWDSRNHGLQGHMFILHYTTLHYTVLHCTML